MPNASPEQLAGHLNEFLKRSNPVLFAGAGIGCRVGFPSWDGYIEHLASTCDRFQDPESASLIRKRLEQHHHSSAAAVFKTSIQVPTGELWKAIAEPFRVAISDEQLDKLVPLVNLPFGAIVTTNYEHSLHDACARARRRWARPFERGQLKEATLSREFFVARLHGSAAQPTSMILDVNDYDSLRTDSDYLDFLLHTLRGRSCLFVGFSFLDPAIAQVLNIYSDRFGPTYSALHTAFIPTSEPKLLERLRQLNIETVEYDPTQGHTALWRGFRLVFESRRASQAELTVPPTDVTGHGPTHRFVAFTFAQARLRAEAESIATIAQDGIVASVLASHPEGLLDDANLISSVAAALLAWIPTEPFGPNIRVSAVA